jgi:hypothetical protein
MNNGICFVSLSAVEGRFSLGTMPFTLCMCTSTPLSVTNITLEKL